MKALDNRCYVKFMQLEIGLLGLVSITRQMPRPRHINKAIIRLSSHPSHKSLCFGSKLVVVVVVIGLMETRLYNYRPLSGRETQPNNHYTLYMNSLKDHE